MKSTLTYALVRRKKVDTQQYLLYEKSEHGKNINAEKYEGARTRTDARKQ